MLREFSYTGFFKKGETLIGLGNGRVLHILSDGTVRTEGLKELPAEAYLMFPLVTKLMPREFEGPGDFTSILELEEKLGSITGRAEDIYEKVGPFLAGEGIPAIRVAKVLLEMSPIKTMKDTGQITEDTYNGYTKGLRNIIVRYYPGSTKSEKENKKRLGGILFWKDDIS
jgi:hypothetical protein